MVHEVISRGASDERDFTIGFEPLQDTHGGPGQHDRQGATGRVCGHGRRTRPSLHTHGECLQLGITGKDIYERPRGLDLSGTRQNKRTARTFIGHSSPCRIPQC